jgi:hypothetical protein
MKIDLESIIVASKEQLSSSIGGETVILGLQAGRYYGVGAAGARVWQIIQEPRRVSDICDAIVSEYEVDPATCQSDLLKLFQQMAEARLIEVRTETSS